MFFLSFKVVTCYYYEYSIYANTPNTTCRAHFFFLLDLIYRRFHFITCRKFVEKMCLSFFSLEKHPCVKHTYNSLTMSNTNSITSPFQEQQFEQLTASRMFLHTLPAELMKNDVFTSAVQRFEADGARFQNIFNPDSKRMQRRLSNTDDLFVSVIAPALKRLGVLRCRHFGQAFVLQSLPGCKQQEWHLVRTSITCFCNVLRVVHACRLYCEC